MQFSAPFFYKTSPHVCWYSEIYSFVLLLFVKDRSVVCVNPQILHGENKRWKGMHDGRVPNYSNEFSHYCRERLQ